MREDGQGKGQEASRPCDPAIIGCLAGMHTTTNKQMAEQEREPKFSIVLNLAVEVIQVDLTERFE